MKKILALLLALVMVLSLAACGGKTEAPAAEAPAAEAPAAEAPAAEASTNPDDIADEMTSADGKYQVAFVTDVGQLKDKSFNQGTYDGVKLYAAANGKSYKYYQPANGILSSQYAAIGEDSCLRVEGIGLHVRTDPVAFAQYRLRLIVTADGEKTLVQQRQDHPVGVVGAVKRIQGKLGVVGQRQGLIRRLCGRGWRIYGAETVAGGNIGGVLMAAACKQAKQCADADQ